MKPWSWRRLSLEVGLRFQKTPTIPTVSLCLLLTNQDVNTQLFLPSCLCSAIADVNPLKPQAQSSTFFSEVPWPWCSVTATESN